MKLAVLILVAVIVECIVALVTGRFIHVGQQDVFPRGDRRGF